MEQHPPTCSHGATVGDCNACGAAAAGMSVEEYLDMRFPPLPDEPDIVDQAMDTPLVLGPSDRPRVSERGRELMRQLRKEAEEWEKSGKEATE